MLEMQKRIECVKSFGGWAANCARSMARTRPETTVLEGVSKILLTLEKWRWTYTRPNESIPINITFCRLLIFRSYTIHVGKIRAMASVTTLIDANVVVTVLKFKHLAFGYASLFQIAAIGRHWNRTKNRLTVTAATLNITRLKMALFTIFFCPEIRNRKIAIDILISLKMGT